MSQLETFKSQLEEALQQTHGAKVYLKGELAAAG